MYSAIASHTGFSDLSTELRNAIYNLALVADGPLNFAIPLSDDDRALKLRIQHEGKINVNLLLVSRQVRDEATPVLCGANTFEVGPRMTSRFLNTIVPSKKHLRRIRYLWIEPSSVAAFEALRALVGEEHEDKIMLHAYEVYPRVLTDALPDWRLELAKARAGTNRALDMDCITFVASAATPGWWPGQHLPGQTAAVRETAFEKARRGAGPHHRLQFTRK